MIVIFKINKCKILTGGNYMFLIKKTFKTISTVLIFLSLSTFSQLSNAGELLVYSSTDADNLKHYMDEFQKQHPDIKVNVVRESTGTMAAKMMAEKIILKQTFYLKWQLLLLSIWKQKVCL